MLMKVILCVVVCIVSIGAAVGGKTASVDELINQMTLEEKIGMLHGANYYDQVSDYTGFVKGVERLGIPTLRMNDGPQGFRDQRHPGTTTAWPSALTVGATWDLNLAYRWGEAIGQEFKGKGANVFLGPGLNTNRVPLNGRNFEYVSGADPYLGHNMVQPIVNGVQKEGVIANAKHWVENSQETNRQSIDEIVDERTRYEIYYMPFEGAVNAGVGSFMCSYNKVNGVYACQNDVTLNKDLKQTLGFEGWVMSDWTATHSTSIKEGLDQEMPGAAFFSTKLKKKVESGEISEDIVNESVRRILTPMQKLGLLNQPTPEFNTSTVVTSATHNTLAKELSEASTILLKNEGHTLPLGNPNGYSNGKPLKIAMLGQGMRRPIIGGGGSGQVYPKQVSAPYDAMMSSLGLSGSVEPIKVECDDAQNLRQNYGIVQSSCISWAAETVEMCADSCASFNGCEYFSFVRGHCSLSPSNSLGGKHVPGTVTGQCKKSTPKATWKCVDGSKHMCVAVSDGNSGTGTLDEALSLVGDADVVVVQVGTYSGEGHDREDLGFGRSKTFCQLEPEGNQDELIESVAQVIKANKEKGGKATKLVVAMSCPGACLTPWRDSVDALVHSVMPGQQYGEALSNVLLGLVNPSGRLSFTMPNKENEMQMTEDQYPGVDLKSHYTEQLEVDYRWYGAHGVQPAFAFGHGLSYTTFAYSDLYVEVLDAAKSARRVASAREKAQPLVKVTFKVTNVGAVPGSEVAQLYLRYPEVAREPPLQLRGFRKTKILHPEETEIVELLLTARDLSVWNMDTHSFELVREEGHEYEAEVGKSSHDVVLRHTFKLP